MITSKLGLVNADQLREITGYTLDGPMKSALEKQGIACFYGKNGPWTTIDLVNIAGMRKLGIDISSDENEDDGVM